MHLRKLAWVVPLWLAAVAAHAEGSGSFLEGAKLAALVRPEATTPANSPHHVPTAVKPVVATSASVTPSPLPAAPLLPDAGDAGATFEIRNFLTLVVALALVGWVQRRRRDA